MHLCILLQPKHYPIPENITVVQNFGTECIMVPPPGMEETATPRECERIYGESAFVSGDEEAFKEWLKPFDGIWICNNPMVGNWKVVHIKRAIEEKSDETKS